jgi:hypothetical protein
MLIYLFTCYWSTSGNREEALQHGDGFLQVPIFSLPCFLACTEIYYELFRDLQRKVSSPAIDYFFMSTFRTAFTACLAFVLNLAHPED